MRKVIMFNRVSIDGFFAGPNGEIDWFGHDPEVDKALYEIMQPDTILFGSGTIVQQLTDEGLIDEYLMVVTPLILGAGKPLLKDVKKVNLALLETRNFKSGNVLLHYGADKLAN